MRVRARVAKLRICLKNHLGSCFFGRSAQRSLAEEQIRALWHSVRGASGECSDLLSLHDSHRGRNGWRCRKRLWHRTHLRSSLDGTTRTRRERGLQALFQALPSSGSGRYGFGVFGAQARIAFCATGLCGDASRLFLNHCRIL